MADGRDDRSGRYAHDDLERLMRGMLQGRYAAPDEESNVVTSHWMPSVDIKEEAERFLIIADIPGVEPEAIEVSMAEGMLTIKGERQGLGEDERRQFRRSERARGSFHRRFSLPETADADRITARSHHGVLTIDIPKRDLATPRKIEVGA
jgi:HSP20 family protein